MSTTSHPVATGSISDAMHAIRAVHPGANVSVELRGEDGYVGVTVSGMAEDTFGEYRNDDDEYPNCWFASGGYLNVNRYRDCDIEAALATALDIITTRGQVAS